MALGSYNSIPSSNMGQSSNFPDSTRLWMANRFTSTEEDYWGCAMGVLWDQHTHTYIQSINKKTSSVYNILLQPTGGNVSINKSSPSYKLDVNGDIRMVGKCIVQTNNSQNGVVCTGTDGGLSYYGYQDGDPGIKFTRTSVFTGEDSEYTLALLPAPGGTPRPNCINLGSSSN